VLGSSAEMWSGWWLVTGDGDVEVEGGEEIGIGMEKERKDCRYIEHGLESMRQTLLLHMR